ncbi:MAG: methionyl-tRNA formyltransferase [Mycoplasmataceae bacterium]|jgi:methionyl-tRNA formyltransferase|nr:methionyl-tRNA formyltransferase [Mycoplasmataceae bacterium]
MYKIIFFGTSKISADILEYLLKVNQIQIVAVVCQKDQKNIPEVKKVCLKNNLKIYQPDKLKPLFNEISLLSPDLIITCSYGKIIPSCYLNLPKYKCVNIHTSFLPLLRGPNPIRYAIMQNLESTGVSLMYMDESMDTGNIIFQEQIKIQEKETYTSLYQKLTSLAVSILEKHLFSLFSSSLVSYPQNNEKATYSSKLTREDEKINWNKDCVSIDCFIRSLKDEPIPYTEYENVLVKIHDISYSIQDTDSSILEGTIISYDKKGIHVKVKDGIINIEKLQIPGKKPILFKDMINGNHIFKVGKKFN